MNELTCEQRNLLWAKGRVVELAKKHGQHSAELEQSLESMTYGQVCDQKNRLEFIDSIRCPVEKEIIAIGYGKKYGQQTLVFRFKKDPENKKRQGVIFERDGKRYAGWQQWSIIMPEGF